MDPELGEPGRDYRWAPSSRTAFATVWFDAVLLVGLVLVQPFLLFGLAFCDGPGCDVGPRWFSFMAIAFGIGLVVTLVLLGIDRVATSSAILAAGVRVAAVLLAVVVGAQALRLLLTTDGDRLLGLVAAIWWLPPLVALATARRAP